jgi:hypothetical protein
MAYFLCKKVTKVKPGINRVKVTILKHKMNVTMDVITPQSQDEGEEEGF